jgi:hypothetical protein
LYYKICWVISSWIHTQNIFVTIIFVLLGCTI